LLPGSGLTDLRVLPGAKSIARGSRAEGRQPQSIKNKVDKADACARAVDTSGEQAKYPPAGQPTTGTSFQRLHFSS